MVAHCFTGWPALMAGCHGVPPFPEQLAGIEPASQALRISLSRERGGTSLDLLAPAATPVYPGHDPGPPLTGTDRVLLYRDGGVARCLVALSVT